MTSDGPVSGRGSGAPSRSNAAPDDDERLLSAFVGDLDRFARDHWGRRPLHRRAVTGLPHLLSSTEIETLLLTGARRPTFRMVRAGSTLAADASTRPTRLGGQVVDDVADLERIGRAMADGATLVMQGLQRTSLHLAGVCRSLERALSHAVQANAYLTPAGASGLAPHRDEHDVLVVQLEGRKAWSIDGLGDRCLEVGDVLYLPAGTEHSATAQEEASLHLTIGILTTTYLDVIRRLAGRLERVALERPLPLGFARTSVEASFADELAGVLHDVAGALADVDAGEVVTIERERASTRRRPLLRGHLSEVLGLVPVGLDTVVVRRPDVAVAVEHLVPDSDPDESGHGDRARLVMTTPDRTVTLPAIARAAVDTLLTGQPVRVRDLPGIDAESRIVVARRLLREAILTRVDVDVDDRVPD